MRSVPLVLHLLARSARVRRKRAVLTIAAIAWGSIALLLLLAFGEGLKRQMVRGTAGMGRNIAVMWPGETSRAWNGLPSGRPIRLRVEDVDLLRARVPDLDGIFGEMTNWSVTLTNGRKSVTGRVTGTTAIYGELRHHMPMPGGRFLDPLDDAQKRRVIFLGDELARDLYGTEDPVGRTLLVSGLPYTVIGVMVKKFQTGMYGGPDASHAVIPLSTFRAQFGRERINNIVLRPKDPAQMKATLARVSEVLGARHQFDPKDERAIRFWDTVESSGMMVKILLGIQIFLGVIGALTLTIGGVGVANIMYATVKERTREIGVQMALGARRGWITAPLVLEGFVYTAVGGILGVLAAIVIVTLLGFIPTEGNEALQFLGKPTLSIPIGLAAAAILGVTGVLAGYFPARRAASIDPAQTLRYE
jgi:putative ABC transport system permease protein